MQVGLALKPLPLAERRPARQALGRQFAASWPSAHNGRPQLAAYMNRQFRLQPRYLRGQFVMESSDVSRRTFIKASAAVTAAATVATSVKANSSSSATSPNERLRIGFI